MFLYLFFLMFLANQVPINCSEGKSPRMIFLSDWKSDTKTPQEYSDKSNPQTTDSGSLSQRSSSFQSSDKLQACLQRVRYSISSRANTRPNNKQEKRTESMSSSDGALIIIPTSTQRKKEGDSPKKISSTLAPSSEPFCISNLSNYNDDDLETSNKNEPFSQDLTSPKSYPHEPFSQDLTSPKSDLQKKVYSAIELHRSNKQKRMSESLSSLTSPTVTNSMLEQNASNFETNMSSSDSPSSSMISITSTTATLVASAAAAYIASNSVPQRRSIDMFGVGSTASAVSWIATLFAAGVTISQLSSFLHSGCKADKDRLLLDFESRLQKHITESKIQADRHAAETTLLLNKIVQKMSQYQDETNNTMDHLLDALEETAKILADPAHNTNNPANTNKAAGAVLSIAAHQAREELTQNNHKNTLTPVPVVKEKTNCCCL